MGSPRRIFLPGIDKMDFINDFKLYSGRVEKWLRENIKVEDSPQRRVYEAMQYSLTAGGKRLRPVLSLAVCDLVRGDEKLVMPFACALELIHTYSLIHDDLPCMDNDDFRRGKPTNHKAFGDALALLAGDGLLNLAYELMLAEVSKDGEHCRARAKTAGVIAEAAGTNGMIGGQVIDLESEGREISYETLCIMHRKKTGALIKAAVLAPLELLEAPKYRRPLECYADKIGLAFQIKDDILDYEGDSSIVGKSLGKDEKNHKPTFVTLLGIQRAKELLKMTVEQAAEALVNIENADFLIKTARWIAKREK